MLFPCYDGLATLSLDLDDLGEAERYFSLAQDVCPSTGSIPNAYRAAISRLSRLRKNVKRFSDRNLLGHARADAFGLKRVSAL